MRAITQRPVRAPQPGDLALTYRQPWASLVMAGVKDVENRTWPVPARLLSPPPCPAGCGCVRGDDADRRDCACDGPCCMDFHWPEGRVPFRLWVHAGRIVDYSPEAEAAVQTLGAHQLGRTPWAVDTIALIEGIRSCAGHLLGSVLVAGCHDSEDCWELRGAGEVVGPAPDGWHCSPWAEEGQYHWLQTDPQPLPEPIPMRGRQKLWRITADDMAGVAA